MADLSNVIDFSVILDYSPVTAELRFTDTSDYPSGVPETIVGSVQIIQPDGLTTVGTLGDIYFDGSELTVAIKELRRDYKRQPQKGVYSVKYTVRATGYDDTVITKSFTLSYKEPTLSVVKGLNVFTPSLSVVDSTTYPQAGHLLQSVQREWDVVVESIANTGGVDQVVDLAIEGYYYDAPYTVSLKSTVEYDIAGNTWVTIMDAIYKTITFDVYTPPTLAALRQSLVDLREDALLDDFRADDYSRASALYEQLLERGRTNDLDGLIEYVLELQKIFNGGTSPVLTHTSLPIPAYDWGAAMNGAIQWDTIIGKPELFEIMFRVGDEGFPQAGDSSYTNNLLTGRKIMVSRGYMSQWSANPGDGNSYYEKLLSSPTIFFYGALQADEPIQIIAL